MIILIGILTSILMFSIIVLVHEYGHFKSARIFGVKVEEFGLGIPPHAKTIFVDKKGTKYTLNFLPLGGFVRLKGEAINTFNLFDEKHKLLNNQEIENKIKNNKDLFDQNKEKLDSEIKKEILIKLQDNYSKDSLLTQSPIKQSIIILAGVFMNFLLAIFIYSILFFIGITPIGINDKIETSLNSKIIPTPQQAISMGLIKKSPGVYLYPVENSVAKISGIMDYDLALEINNKRINDYNEFKNIIGQNSNKKITIKVSRFINCDFKNIDNCKSETKFIDIIPDKNGKIGAYLGENIEINKNFKYPNYSIIESIKYGVIETYTQIRLTLSGLKSLVVKIVNPKTTQERSEAINQMSGPIGIVDFITKSISNGIIFIFIISASISINLGVFNLLPIPALDGGRFVLITINGIIQKIFGKKAINENIENILHFTFFIFLIALSILIAYNDIGKIIK